MDFSTLFELCGEKWQNGNRNKVFEKMEDVSSAAQERNHENEETEALIVNTDADIVKELVEMKFLTKKGVHCIT